MSEPFKNPLTFTSITEMIVAIMNVVIIIATPIIVFFLIYAGFMYVTAQGNPQKIEIASRSLLYGIIGGVIILGSVAILAIVKNVVGAF
ncbi:hypothetical protein KC902_01030 [Candidatus Kaiserbacteria bacterium]|nr:hypothetical protein [Candidatus Kaiserbacteria bacterium]USN88515.1 MAG: hypothetical protein H6780_03410 [Candidatus Nomurabacteria bacterium]